MTNVADVTNAVESLKGLGTPPLNSASACALGRSRSYP